MLTLTQSPYPRRLSLASLLWMRPEDVVLPSPGKGFLQLVLKVAIILAAVYATHLVLEWATEKAMETGNEHLMIGVFATLLLAYALLIAVPFMPGIEIGISLLMLQGATIAPLVYLATVLGLALAYFVGRYLPVRWVRGLLADLRLKRACAMVDRLAPMSRADRLAHLTERAPNWMRPLFGRGRYVLLGALINLPGNAVIGGGGGIAFIAGFSRLFRPVYTIAVFVAAVLPVPFMVWAFGSTSFLN